MSSTQTKFFEFRQNNSGGYFVRDDNLDTRVFVEAADALHANAIAQTLGIYFEGVSAGRDCACCGDRWYEASTHADVADSESDIEVSSWDREARQWTGVPLVEAVEQKLPLGTFDDCGVVIHRLDGTKTIYRGPGFVSEAA